MQETRFDPWDQEDTLEKEIHWRTPIFSLENPMDTETWRATDLAVEESQTTGRLTVSFSHILSVQNNLPMPHQKTPTQPHFS